jgi:hypothetical protein
MRMHRLGVVALMAVAVSACGGGVSVSSDWDPTVDFSNLRTFAVMDEVNGETGFVNQRIKNAITSTLTGKGMEQVDDASTADVAVGFQITTDQRSSFSTLSTVWGGYGWGGWHGGMGMSTSTTRETVYDVGTMVIGMFDPDQEQMIFQSTGSATLPSGNITPEESQARINDAVDQILRDFPPGS